MHATCGSFLGVHGPDLLARLQPYHEWHRTRTDHALWHYSRSLESAPGPEAAVASERGERLSGVNFASQDYLALSSHPAIHEVAARALRDFGPHSAGSSALLGNTRLSLQLEAALAEFLGGGEVTLFPTGWGAGFGVVTGLVRPADHIILDERAHACLQQGAAAATRNIRRCRHLDVERVGQLLARIRADDRENAILVVTEGLFSMDSTTPDVARLQELCHEWGATLLVDVAHDLGSLGPDGLGALGEHSLVGSVDLVIGAFSKTFASNGGFVWSRANGVRQFLKMAAGPACFSNALSPLQAAVVAEALAIVRSVEGARRRADLLSASLGLRAELAARAIEPLGRPSPIVPVVIGREPIARLAIGLLHERGMFVNLAEHPAVPLHGSRFRLQVMATHTPEHARMVAQAIAEALAEASALVARWEADG